LAAKSENSSSSLCPRIVLQIAKLGYIGLVQVYDLRTSFGKWRVKDLTIQLLIYIPLYIFIILILS